MADLTVQPILQTGLEAATAAATASTGDTFINDDRTILKVINGSGSDITVSVTAVRTSVKVPGMGTVAVADLSVVVTAGETRYIKVPPFTHNNSSGKATVICSAVTSVTLSVLRIPGE